MARLVELNTNKLDYKQMNMPDKTIKFAQGITGARSQTTLKLEATRI